MSFILQDLGSRTLSLNISRFEPSRRIAAHVTWLTFVSAPVWPRKSAYRFCYVPCITEVHLAPMHLSPIKKSVFSRPSPSIPMQFQNYLSKTTCPITSYFQTSYVFRVNTFDSRGDCCRNIEAFDFLGLARGWGVNRDRFSLFPIAFICDEPKSYQFFRRGLLRCALLYLRCGKVTSSSYSLLHPKSTPPVFWFLREKDF